MSKNFKNIAFWVVLFLLLVALFNVFNSNRNSESSREVSFSEFMRQVDNGKVLAVRLDGETILVRSTEGNSYKVIRPAGQDILEKLLIADVEIQAVKQEKSGFMSTLSLWLPFLLLILTIPH